MEEFKYLAKKRGNEILEFEHIFNHNKIEYSSKSLFKDSCFADFSLLSNHEAKVSFQSDPVKILERNTRLFILALEFKFIDLDLITNEVQLSLFFIACNYLKEMDKQIKLYGLKLIELLYDRIKEEYFKNAYIFEKDLIKNYHLATGTHKTKKFVSLGDYEVSKVDSNIGVNYGFFATALDDEKKEIKIECLKLIKEIGKKYKSFAETSFKYIVEIINDEEDEVRYETIYCLEDLISNFKELDAKTCEIIYFNLNEKSFRLRKMIYSLLSRIFFISSKDYRDFIKTILDSLKLFPEDRKNIFDCLKQTLQNNIKFIDLGYITESLGLDKNFLFPEYNWYDINYAMKLIIFQEYFKTSSEPINIPSFFVKHLIYFSNKYPQVFEREFVDNFIKHKINTFDKNTLSDNPQRDTNQFIFDDSKLQEKLIVLETKLDSMNMNEIYSSFYFYFLNSIDYLLDGAKIKELIFILISKFIFINDLINLKLEDINNIKCKELNLVNEYLVSQVLLKLFNFLKFTSNETVINELNDIIGKGRKLSFLNKYSNPIQRSEYSSLEECIRESFGEVLNNKLITCSFINPKNYYQYCCPRYNITFPYLLAVDIKLKNISINSTSLRKIHLLLQRKDENTQKIFFNPSDFEYFEKEKFYNLKTKIPLVINPHEENLHDFFLVFYSRKQELFSDFMKKIKFDFKNEKAKEDKYYILGERDNIQIIIEN